MTNTPRLSYERLPESLRDLLQPRVERLGYLGEFFQVAAHQPDALAHFIGFTEALKEALPVRLVEAIALTVATETGNDYERVQHERLALKVGFDVDEVRALVGGDVARPQFDELECAAVELARAVVAAQGRGCEPAFAGVEGLAGPDVAVGCLMTATRYLAHATMANTWGLRAPVASPLDQEPVHG